MEILPSRTDHHLKMDDSADPGVDETGGTAGGARERLKEVIGTADSEVRGRLSSAVTVAGDRSGDLRSQLETLSQRTAETARPVLNRSGTTSRTTISTSQSPTTRSISRAMITACAKSRPTANEPYRDRCPRRIRPRGRHQPGNRRRGRGIGGKLTNRDRARSPL